MLLYEYRPVDPIHQPAAVSPSSKPTLDYTHSLSLSECSSSSSFLSQQQVRVGCYALSDLCVLMWTGLAVQIYLTLQAIQYNVPINVLAHYLPLWENYTWGFNGWLSSGAMVFTQGGEEWVNAFDKI